MDELTFKGIAEGHDRFIAVTRRWFSVALLFGLLVGCRPPQSFALPVRVTTHKRTPLVASRRTAVGTCTVTRAGAPDTRYREVCLRCRLTDLRQQCREDNQVGKPGGATDCGQCHWEETP